MKPIDESKYDKAALAISAIIGILFFGYLYFSNPAVISLPMDKNVLNNLSINGYAAFEIGNASIGVIDFDLPPEKAVLFISKENGRVREYYGRDGKNLVKMIETDPKLPFCYEYIASIAESGEAKYRFSVEDAGLSAILLIVMLAVFLGFFCELFVRIGWVSRKRHCCSWNS